MTTQGSALQWLPSANRPVGWVTVDGKRYPVTVDPTFYRFLWTIAEIKLGGVGAQSIPSLTETSAATVAASQANAAALTSTIAVLQDTGAPGAGDIPPVEPVPDPVYYPPGYIIP